MLNCSLPDVSVEEWWDGPDRGLLSVQSPTPIDSDTLAAAIQDGCSYESVKHYLQIYRSKEVQKEIAKAICKTAPLIFFAAARNSVSTVKLLLQYGADPDAKGLVDGYDVPLLGFVIIHGGAKLLDTTDMVKTLLAWGANPHLLPKSLWFPIKKPSYEVAEEREQDTSEDTKWCRPEAYQTLQSTLHLSHRYLLHIASIIEKPTKREAQVAAGHGMTDLLKIPYYLVGQRHAAAMIKDRILQQIEVRTPYRRPLVMAFVGPSGHGKTELARQMGSLLSLDMQIIDVAQMQSAHDFLGGTPSYRNSEQGSQLTNFLVRHNGKRGVIFLDEFDKTTKEVRDSMLLMLGSGRGIDRMSNRELDCSQIIWILATNLGEQNIKIFYGRRLKNLPDEAQLNVPLDELRSQLETTFREEWGAPFTGRIDTIVPFFPFNLDEQLAVVHKYFLELSATVKKPIDLTSELKRFLGHCENHMVGDGDVCEDIAKRFYVSELGARSLIRGVTESIESKLFKEYMKGSFGTEKVTEKINEGPLQKFTTLLRPSADGAEIIVRNDSKPTDRAAKLTGRYLPPMKRFDKKSGDEEI